MPAPWRKLWAKMVECEDLAALLPPEPAPEMLFVRIIATADAYGRVPGEAYMLRARTFPKSDYTAAQIMACAQALADRGMLSWYEIGGKQYIQVTNSETYNPPDWSKTGAPEFPHPVGWQPPESLLTFLRTHVHLEPFTYARYGLTDPTLGDTQSVHSECSLRGDTQRTLSDTQPPRESRSETRTSTPLVGVNDPADAGGTDNGADTDLHLLTLPAPLAEDGGNGKAKRKRRGSRTARPRYKAREPEKMDADEADADALLEAAGLAHRVDAMLQLAADTSDSGELTQRAAIEQKLRILHTANQYGVANTNAGIEAAIRAEAGAEYAAKVAQGAYLKEERETDGETE